MPGYRESGRRAVPAGSCDDHGRARTPAATGRRPGRGRAFVLALALVAGGWPPGAIGLTLPLPAAGDVVGSERVVVARYEDTLAALARAHGLGLREIVDANPGVDPWLPGAGTRIVLPTRLLLPDAPREGVVINLAEMRLYYYPPDRDVVITHPLGIGRQGWATPVGRTRVIAKQVDPPWFPPESIRAEHAARGDPLPARVPPGPDNPLGRHALRLELPGYLIHGTNRPNGVGLRVSHGCLRLYPEDVAALYREVPLGTPVTIVDQPFKAGWDGATLLLESHQPLSVAGASGATHLTPLVTALLAASAGRAEIVDWDGVMAEALEFHGMPRPVATRPHIP